MSLDAQLINRIGDGEGNEVANSPMNRQTKSAELAIYENVAASEVASGAKATFDRSLRRPVEQFESNPLARLSFPQPRRVWIDSSMEASALYMCYRYLRNAIAGRAVLQIGGSGVHGVKFLLASASRVHLVTPVHAEAELAVQLAELAGVRERLFVTRGFAERLPIRAGSVEAVFAGGCLHHTDTAVALQEIHRVLSEGGRFAALDPWKAIGYKLGTRIFGKRERDVYCSPLDRDRIGEFEQLFGNANVTYTGVMLRYILGILVRTGGLPPPTVSYYLTLPLDASLGRTRVGRLLGSCVALCGEK